MADRDEPEDGSRRAWILALLGVVAIAAFLVWSRAHTPAGGDRHVFEGATMGTSYRVIVRGVEPDERSSIAERIETELNAVNASMSTYIDDSELSRFNRSAVGEPFAVSPELETVVDEAQRVSEASDGAFDVTVGALVDLWGFGPQKDPPVPSDAAIQSVQEGIGWQRLERSAGTMTRTTPQLRVDLSAVAKGYAVDRIATALTDAGISDFMVEVGGEVRTAGDREPGQAWRIGVENPESDSGPQSPHRVVELSDLAMATSGDYRNYREVDGRRLSHTIDSRTGRPIEHGLASVSVIAARAARADAWATALTVLGPDAGFALAQEQDLAVYMIVRKPDGFEIHATPAFKRHIVEP